MQSLNSAMLEKMLISLTFFLSTVNTRLNL
jgi:hypothetical protein